MRRSLPARTFDDKSLEVRPLHSSEEAREQIGAALKAQRSGLAERKRSQQKLSRDSEHGKFSLRLERLGKVEKEYVTYLN